MVTDPKTHHHLEKKLWIRFQSSGFISFIGTKLQNINNVFFCFKFCFSFLEMKQGTAIPFCVVVTTFVRSPPNYGLGDIIGTQKYKIQWFNGYSFLWLLGIYFRSKTGRSIDWAAFTRMSELIPVHSWIEVNNVAYKSSCVFSRPFWPFFSAGALSPYKNICHLKFHKWYWKFDSKSLCFHELETFKKK